MRTVTFFFRIWDEKLGSRTGQLVWSPIHPFILNPPHYEMDVDENYGHIGVL